MSKRVCTRQYRPPEVCLIEKNYDAKVDIWGAGCVFAELLKTSRESTTDYVPIRDRVLFNGDSCFLLSPHLE